MYLKTKFNFVTYDKCAVEAIYAFVLLAVPTIN